ncbi:MAG: Hsp20/alpha crystallin family protein [Myxococcales bacterium]|nr:Hsp20/alpha crystallin family protein [Myxococcales bacterium]
MFATRWPWLFEDSLLRPEELFRVFAPYLGTPSRRSGGAYPPVNVFDDGQRFLVRAEVPGVKKDSLEVTAQGDQLTIRGERPAPARGEEGRYHRRECQYGPFRRTVTLPEPIDAEKIEATYRAGVLEVVLPRTPEAQPRKISVN